MDNKSKSNKMDDFMEDKKLSNENVGQIVKEKTNEMYKNVGLVQEELGKIELEGSSDKGLAKVTLTGQHEMKGLSINPELMKGSKEDLENSIKAAYKDAKTKMEDQVKLKMTEMAKELGFYG
jgi:DNA-binding YbaB/EbfC family protein